MKTMLSIFIIFLFQVRVCKAQVNMRPADIPYQYCCQSMKISVDAGMEAHLEGFSESDISKIVVCLDYKTRSARMKSSIYLTSVAPYPQGTNIRTEVLLRNDSLVRLRPLNLNQYWLANPLTVYVTVVYSRGNGSSGSFTFGRADKRNIEEVKALNILCPVTKAPPPPRKVLPAQKLNSVIINSRIFPNRDALDLLKAFNPELSGKDSVLATGAVKMPPFPALTFEQRRSARKQYKESRKPDPALSAQYDRSAANLKEGLTMFSEHRFPAKNTSVQHLESKLKELNYYCINIRPYSRKTGRKTMLFLSRQTDALNAILRESVSKSAINDDQFRDCQLLMDNIYINVRKIADRYHVRPYSAARETGYMDQPVNELFASGGPAVPLPPACTPAPAVLPYADDPDVCYHLTWWEKLFRPRTEKTIYVYVYKCSGELCPGDACNNTPGCFDGCSGQYTVVASCIGADPECFSGLASAAHTTLTDAKWTFSVYKGTNTGVAPVKSETIYTRTASCDSNKKQLQIWLKLEQ